MMALPLSDIETLFDQIPGIVLYHLSVIIVAIAVLAVLLFHRTRPAGTRAIVVCLSVLVFQLAGFLPYSLSLFSAGTENSIAGILARGLLLGTVLLFGWYCLFPQRTRPWEWIVGFTAFLSIVIGMALSWLLFPPNFTVWFNSQTLSLIWDGIICFWIFFFLLGFLASMLRKKKPSAWGLSLFGLFLMLVGTALQISMFPQPTQLPGLSRFFDLWAFPLLLIQLLVSTAPAANLELFLPEAMGEAGSSDQPAQKIESAFLRFKIRQATAEYAPLLADLFLSEEDEEFVRALTGWLCHAVQAEVAYLLASSDEGQTLVFLSGHDCINARAIPGFVVTTTEAGQLAQAIAGHRILRINWAAAEAELSAVARESGLPHAGPGLFAPLGDAGENLGGILLLAAYSGSNWRREDEVLVTEYSRAVTGAMRFIIARAHLRHALDRARTAGEQSNTERDALLSEKQQWEKNARLAEQKVTTERNRAEEKAASSAEQNSWQEERAGFLTQIHQLEDTLAESASRERERNGEAEKLRADSNRLKDALAAIASHQAETKRLQAELDSTRQELEQRKAGADTDQGNENETAQLKLMLSESEARASEELARLNSELGRKTEELSKLQTALLQAPREDRPAEGLSHSDLSMMSSLISELRQPMSSAIGYTDLLLSESAGILGALQRKFLERTRAGISRMEALLDDLLQLALLADTTASPRVSPVDITAVIDAALTSTSESIRERNLVVRMDIADPVPLAEIDHDAVQQIANHLIHNAVLATPPEKEISITANMPGANREGQGALLLTVQDSGAGIPAEDQPRVFTRLYRAEGPMIEGLGDPGVGMAVARTLTEALGGRIWMESQIGRGTTFFVLLPWRAAQLPSAESQ